MIFNMTGGGNPLNFKVVGGTTEPSNPKENIIWVETEKINNWYFSSTKPEGPQELDVWISTGAVSSGEFNALKKNGIQVCPISAKQYVSGAWVVKTAKIYQGGQWADWWNGDLLTPSDEFYSETGGWIADTTAMYGNITKKAPTVTKNTDNIQLVLSGVSVSGCYRTKNKVDISGFSELTTDVVITAKSAIVRLYLMSELTIWDKAVASTTLTDKGNFRGQGSIDLTNVPVGKYYIFVGMSNYDASSPVNVKTSRVGLKR